MAHIKEKAAEGKVSHPLPPAKLDKPAAPSTPYAPTTPTNNDTLPAVTRVLQEHGPMQITQDGLQVAQIQHTTSGQRLEIPWEDRFRYRDTGEWMLGWRVTQHH